jgi:uncharacterized membrane protein YedE/YeeE
MLSLHPAVTLSSCLPSLLGGLLLGLLSLARLQTTASLMRSATPHLFSTLGAVLGACFLDFAHPRPLRGSGHFASASLEPSTLVVSALLVSIGAKLGAGCTYGNGIQGLGFLSRASLAHVGTFMLAGVATATYLNLGDSPGIAAAAAGKIFFNRATSNLQQVPFQPPSPLSLLVDNGGLLGCALFGVLFQFLEPAPRFLRDVLAGASFSSALLLAGMGSPLNITAFLDLNTPTGWDPRVCVVMGGALLVTVPAYASLTEKDVGPGIWEWKRRPVTPWVILGGVCFGVGWGLSGLCPGPAYVAAGFGEPAFAGVLLGSRLLMDAAEKGYERMKAPKADKKNK